MIVKSYYILFFLFLGFNAFSQDCHCNESFEHLYKKIVNNYIGAKDLINKTTGLRFHKLSDSIRLASKNADSIECYYLLKKWVSFFNDYHLDVYLNYSKELKEGLIRHFKKAPSIQMDSVQLEQYLTSHKLDFIEGKWKSSTSNEVIAIVRDTKNKNVYIGFVLQMDSWFWSYGQIRFKIQKVGNRKYRTIEYYKADMEKAAPPIFVDGQMFYFKGASFFIKEGNGEQNRSYYKGRSPSFTRINESTIVFRLPSFSSSYKSTIDSLVDANKSIIENTPTLIIDIRGNDGGFLNCVDKLMPYLYTNPIKTVGGQVLASPDNIKYFESIASDSTASLSEREDYQIRVGIMKNKVGEVVEVIPSKTQKYGVVYKYPQNVAIIMNHNVVSAGELFILKARQSKKVKLFGSNSYGAVDYTEVYEYFPLPCRYYWYYFPMTKISTANRTTFHNKGISPDVYIPVDTFDWVKFVHDYFNNK